MKKTPLTFIIYSRLTDYGIEVRGYRIEQGYVYKKQEISEVRGKNGEIYVYTHTHKSPGKTFVRPMPDALAVKEQRHKLT